MAKHVTNEMREEMLRLYAELGTYSAVAAQLGISATTVSKHIKAQQSIKTYNTCVAPKSIESIPLNDILSFSYLTDEEKQSYSNWLKEFGR